MANAKGKLNSFKFIIDVWNEPNSIGSFWRTGDVITTPTQAGIDYTKLVQEIRYRLNLETDDYVKGAFINGAGMGQPNPNAEEWLTAAVNTSNSHDFSLKGLKALNSIGIHYYSNKL
ncbi:MAG: hypothetical protein EOO42_21490 [Flavobacteriales bacterium]|nr:MAG: hypothetical protein EOO42_21490 [Flavobacteriales bacterium]